ncbi:MAG: ATP-binding protein [Candidatus Electrothrix aestuarii]|uniref:ATP-binding protein n=1 Tax=Candidatus Electrothrix aestuarii TaxID=3062594 RepID=A0AAU8LYA6_9BACT|nr:ATP-binding protein [Candidatus Electrothrix aestuarii]
MNFNLQGYIKRQQEKNVADSLASFPVTALLGPRQCGKSTLAKHLLSQRDDAVFLDLERPSDLRKLTDPELFFHTHRDKLICIDEVQMGPAIFPLLRATVDDDRRPGRFFLLGSASQELIRKSSETLAGRIHYIELTPFTCTELLASSQFSREKLMELWARGGFPESVLAVSDAISLTWREDFIRTFLERDINQFEFSVAAQTMRRFWSMLAHYHGQVMNYSKLGQALGVTHPTVKRYLELLEQTYMVRSLAPYSANIKKRLVKAPKIYLRDSGVLHALLEIDTLEDLLGHPVVGGSWEGFCIEQILAAKPNWRASFYRTSSGEEIDLILERGQKSLAFEFKASMSPKVSRGFNATLEILQPNHTWIIAPVPEPYPFQQNVTVSDIFSVVEEITGY